MASRSIRIGRQELTLSNIEKILYPGTGFTKGQVIDFYTRLAPIILPHLKNRPITMKRFPDGIGGKHFYEKNAPSFTPSWIKTFPIPRSGGKSLIRYVLINDAATLVWSANMANLEIHPFLARVPDIHRPTMVVFDLDPGEGADILQSCEVALYLKALLDRLRLESMVKVSGSKGIHVHVPLNTRVTYDATRAFAKSIAQYLETEHPRKVVFEMAKARRAGRVLIDWSQNAEHKSTVAVYSLRAKAERPFVAMPIRWAELKKAVRKNDSSLLFFEPEEALRRLKKVGDLFAPALRLEQKLPPRFLALDATASDDTEPASLDVYRRKRNFAKTPEPAPAVSRARPGEGSRLFVVQKHAARRLHYDFRLEMGGALKSWAVPKGPSYDLNERRLAMATEDHPMEYARFEGIIPAGEYGGGTVMVWDIGTYELIDGNYHSGKLHVLLSGSKLRGEWVLVKSREDEGKDNVWYLIKAAAALARPDSQLEDCSALTGRSLDEIADAQDAVWHSNRTDAGGSGRPGGNDGDSFLDSLPEIRAAFIEPMLAEAISQLPEDTRAWSYEIKWDGYRCVAVKERTGVKLYSRKNNLLNSRFPELVQALQTLQPQTVMDGEIVALDESGRPSFNRLQNHRPSIGEIYFYAFDLLVDGGRSLLAAPLEQRREALALRVRALSDRVRMSESFEGSAQEIVASARELSLEGVIAKRKGSLYEPGKRSGAWLKYKINQSQVFVIGGYTPGHPFDALIVGYYEGDDFLYAGKVRNGFVPGVRRQVAGRFKGLETGACPFANLPEKRRTPWALTRSEMKNCVWLEPKLRVEIEFAEWTPDRHLRAARFLSLREPD